MATMKSAVQASHGVALRRPNSAARCLLAASSSQESLFRSVPQPLFLRISLVWFCFAHHVFFSIQKRRGGSEGRRALLVFFSSKIVAVLLSQFIFVRQHRVLCSRQTGRTLGSYPTVFVFASSQKRHNGGSFVSDGRRHR